MKNFLLLLVLFASVNAKAQMDDKFYYPSKKMLPMDSVTFEEFTLPVDTVQVTGAIFKPKGKPKATILFFHGAGGNITNYLFMTRPLVEAGYQVAMIDFRGYGRSTGKPTHVNIAADGQKVLDFLFQMKEVKGTKMLIYGASVGSQVAVHLARRNESKLAALILDGTVSSFTDLAADHSPQAQQDMIRRFFRTPYSAREDIKEVKTIPVLFIHSKEDKDVPFEEAEAVYNNAPGSKSLFLYSGKHLEVMKSDAAGALRAISNLLKS